MKSQYDQLLDLENWVRTGNFAFVIKALRKVNSRTIPRDYIVQYANIANRVDQPRFAYRILQKVIKNDQRMNVTPSENEKIEYSESLRLMGLIGDAKKILNGIDSDRYPIVHLRLAFCNIVQWKYDDAISHLQKYINLTSTDDYSHQVARVNLAAALVHAQANEEALVLLEKLKEDSRRNGNRLLLGNSLELMSQIFIQQKNYELANKTIDEAVRVMGDSSSRFYLYLKKWKAICQSLQSQRVDPEVVNCREQARQNKDWETVRDCDLYIGFVTKDSNLINHLYFGTPNPYYRKRIKDLLGTDLELPVNFIWSPSGELPSQEIFNLLEGSCEISGANMGTGHLMHQLLILLCSDFYRPLSVSTAFSELFPEESFSQAGSANRVAQVVKRLRAWFKKNSDLFSIEGKEGSYRIILQPGAAIRMPQEMPSLSLQSVAWKKLTSGLQSNLFSKQDVIQQLGCSRASAERLLRWAVDSEQVAVISGGPSRRYRLHKEV